MTGQDLRRARDALGLTMGDMARELRLTGSPKQVRNRIAAMEAGAVEISGPVARCVELLMERCT